jgi:hypothetical protein
MVIFHSYVSLPEGNMVIKCLVSYPPRYFRWLKSRPFWALVRLMPLADDLRPEPQKQVGFPCLLEKPIIVYHTHTQIYIYIGFPKLGYPKSSKIRPFTYWNQLFWDTVIWLKLHVFVQLTMYIQIMTYTYLFGSNFWTQPPSGQSISYFWEAEVLRQTQQPGR